MTSASGSAFSEEILADKLAKLNNTQQCIESILDLIRFLGQISREICLVILKFTAELQFLR
jgi:hypothetical protein